MGEASMTQHVVVYDTPTETVHYTTAYTDPQRWRAIAACRARHGNARAVDARLLQGTPGA